MLRGFGWRHALRRTIRQFEHFVELAARKRLSEDAEDADELRDGCEKLGALARDTDGDKPRRVSALKSLRMMPCPKQDLPMDLDAK